MKRAMIILLSVLLFLSQAVHAQGGMLVAPNADPSVYNPNIDEETGQYVHPDDPVSDSAPLDDLPHVRAADYPLEDIEFLFDTVYGALPLLTIAVDSTTRADEFTGAPSAVTAWRAIYRFLTTQTTEDGGAFDFGLRLGRVSGQNVTAVYDALFAYGRVPSREENVVSWLTEDGEDYLLEAVAPDSWKTAWVNGINADASGDLTVDVSVITEYAKGGSEFAYNATVTLLPDESALYSAKIGGVRLRSASPYFSGAEAMYGNGEVHTGENGAMNAIDLDDTTFWMFDPDRYPSVTLNAGTLQTVRGLCLIPYNATSEEAMGEYGRVRVIRVTLSNGNIYEKEFDDYTDFTQWECMPFEGVQAVNWARIEVLEIYEGSAHRAACITDLYFF